MLRLKVGEPLQRGVTQFEAGVHYNYTQGGHTLTIARTSPSRSEIDHVQRGRSTFALVTADQALFFLAKFAESPWQVAHYNWWLNPPIMRPDPWGDLQRLKDGVTVSVCLVNASNGVVEALRAVRLSHEFTCSLLGSVELQSRRRFDPCNYLEVVEKTRTKYADGSGMIANALCICAADFKFAKPADAEMPRVRQ